MGVVSVGEMEGLSGCIHERIGRLTFSHWTIGRKTGAMIYAIRGIPRWELNSR